MNNRTEISNKSCQWRISFEISAKEIQLIHSFEILNMKQSPGMFALETPGDMLGLLLFLMGGVSIDQTI